MTLPEQVSQAGKWALVVGLAFFAADTTSAVLERRLQVEAKPLPPAAVIPAQENAPAEAVPPGLVSLLRTTLSGAAGEKPAASQANPSVKAAPKKAPNNLKLQGTMAAGGDGAGLAMIFYNGQTQVVGVGEQIAGMTLKSVSAYSVRLLGNGQEMILEMSSNAQLAPPPPTSVVNTPSPAVAAEPPVISQDPDANGDSGAILTQRELRNILDNPAAFAGKGFRMKPVLTGGEIVGMRVAISNPSHPLARLGINNGDVVKSLNGTPLNGPESLSNIYRILRNTSNLSFEVMRGGQEQKIDISLEE